MAKRKRSRKVVALVPGRTAQERAEMVRVREEFRTLMLMFVSKFTDRQLAWLLDTRDLAGECA